ncbi:TlpA disulfide reductase family protein [Mucilaginibacter sp. L196]|uniref:TlpA family protein disulfide reductase n=1 Tax=Mucilaginibacter sp. L196 TaxID=1641870 RepID=UPI00131AA89F|nr:TlpA disulfide reductase family protein [Mucilaginibacter sp. L196]
MRRIIKISLLVLVSLSITRSTLAQSQIEEIQVGRKIPDVKINGIINYSTQSANVSDFKGKLLILDFWATYCAPCISMFPKTDSLEKLFNGKIQFLSITKESKGKVNDFLNRMYEIKNIKPLTVVNDTLFSQFFPFSSIPYYVWIDANGKVIATTSSEGVTASNIEAVLTGKPTTFENRKDLRFRKLDIRTAAFVISNNFVLKDSLAKREEIPNKNIFSYSIATKAVDETAGHMHYNMDRFSVIDVTVSMLYKYYYAAGYYDSPVQGAFDSKLNYSYEIHDPKLLNRIDLMDEAHIKPGTIAMHNWLMENTVCYEINYPAGLKWKDKMALVGQDLDRYFAKPMGFEVHVEHRLDSNTMALRCLNSQSPLGTTGEKPEEHHDRYGYVQHNLPLNHLISLLNSYFFQDQKISFVDKTAITHPVDLDLICDMTNLQSINSSLLRYGLKLNKEPTKIDVLVFSDVKR